MKRLILVALLVVGVTYATKAQKRGYDYSREGGYREQRGDYDDDDDDYRGRDRDRDRRRYYDDDDRRGRGWGWGHDKRWKKYRDCDRGYYERERVVVVRPRYPYPPVPPPPVYWPPRRPRVSGVIVFGSR